MKFCKNWGKIMVDQIAQELLTKFEDVVLINEEMSKHTTIHIGGKVKAYIEPTNVEDLKTILEILSKANKRVQIIGNASNLVFDSKAMDLYVVSLLKLKGISIDEKHGIVTAMAGEMLSACFAKSAAIGLSGFEYLCGIPATIGGAVAGNAGAFGKDISDYLISLTVLDEKLNLMCLERKNIEFGYRKSNIKEKKYIIISASFRLDRLAPSTIYSIAQQFANKRKLTQPSEYSAGCVFKRAEIAPAGFLIDEVGLKGLRVGGCEISKVHANFIINLGNGTSSDYKKLEGMIKKKIKSKYNLILIREVEYIK